MSDSDSRAIVTDVRAIRETLARNLRREREAAGYSQQALAAACLIGRNTISRIERGEHEPRIATLVGFSLALDVPLCDLLVGLHSAKVACD
jgi:transcriptional regulator with XRE-family HTH domain